MNDSGDTAKKALEDFWSGRVGDPHTVASQLRGASLSRRQIRWLSAWLPVGDASPTGRRLQQLHNLLDVLAEEAK